MGAILCLVLAQLRLRAPHDDLGERRGVRAQPRAKRPERSGQRGRLGDRVSRKRRRHLPKCRPHSTGTNWVAVAMGRPSRLPAWREAEVVRMVRSLACGSSGRARSVANARAMVSVDPTILAEQVVRVTLPQQFAAGAPTPSCQENPDAEHWACNVEYIQYSVVLNPSKGAPG